MLHGKARTLIAIIAGVALPSLTIGWPWLDALQDRAAIAQILNAQQQAWNHGDVDAFLEGYWHSPELTFSGSSGISRGWDAVRERYKRTYPDTAAMGHLDFSGLEYRFLGRDAALVLGNWRLKREKGDIGGVFSLVWQRFPEGWRIIHDHTSAVDRVLESTRGPSEPGRKPE